MAKASHLVNLFRAGAKGDSREFRVAAEHVIADEREKKHGVLAERLSEIIHTSERPLNGRVMENGLQGYLTEKTPQRALDSLILRKETITLIEEFVQEHHRADLLKSYGLLPRHKILLRGKPGNGKTALAEAVAYELMVPLVMVNYDGVIGKFLGETSARLKKIFEYAREMKCVLFFDEFDAIGKERSDEHETGEIKRVVSTLLMRMDELPSYTTVIVASNHADILDSAVWRRFQLRIDMPPPTNLQKNVFINDYAKNTGFKFGMPTADIVSKLKVASFAEVEEFCRDVLRQATLEMSRESAGEIAARKLKQWDERYKVKGKSRA